MPSKGNSKKPPSTPAPDSKQVRRNQKKSINVRMAVHILEQLDAIVSERGTDRTAFIQDAVATAIAAHVARSKK